MKVSGLGHLLYCTLQEKLLNAWIKWYIIVKYRLNGVLTDYEGEHIEEVNIFLHGSIAACFGNQLCV